ncbi:MAG: folate family ECF transporter S component [Oscillospiraceae bacterium]|nr:folate family ECF transporter S component [Oscillospiraceae bacterium]
MSFFSMFRASARELKSIKCLTVTGVLIAVYVLLNTFVSIKLPTVKLTFNYLPLSVIGMLYGPCVSTLAAIPADIISTLLEGKSIAGWLIPSRIAEGFIYGLFFYRLKFIKNKKQTAFNAVRIISARFSVMFLCYMLYNTTVLFFIYGVSEDAYNVYFYLRLSKNVIQFPVDLFLLFTLLPAINIAYYRVFRERKNV